MLQEVFYVRVLQIWLYVFVDMVFLKLTVFASLQGLIHSNWTFMC